MIDLATLLGLTSYAPQSYGSNAPPSYSSTQDQYASDAPPDANGGGGGGLGSRLSTAMGAWSQPTGAGLSALHAPMATPPMHSNGLAQAVANDPRQQSSTGLYALLQRLGVIH